MIVKPFGTARPRRASLQARVSRQRIGDFVERYFVVVRNRRRRQRVVKIVTARQRQPRLDASARRNQDKATSLQTLRSNFRGHHIRFAFDPECDADNVVTHRGHPSDAIVIRVQHRYSARHDSADHFRFRFGDLVNRVEKLQMSGSHNRDYPNGRRRDRRQSRDLAFVIHSHLEHGIIKIGGVAAFRFHLQN